MAELTRIPAAPPPEPPPRHWSVASAASLACGAFFILPFLAGLTAILLGILGLRQINLSNMRGRRLAVAGISLGLLNILGWTVYLRFISQISAPGRILAHQFIEEISADDPAPAQRECVANVRPDRLTAASNQLKQWGGVRSVAVLHIISDTSNGVTTGSVRGTVRTPTGDHAFQLQTVSDHTSNWKVTDFSFQ